MNKYEENISDIITLDPTEEIVDIFIEHALNIADTIGIIANKELVEYALDKTLSEDWISVRKVDLELDEDIEYMISIDPDGKLVVQPVVEYSDKYFTAMNHVYISMDGDVVQTTIDNCLKRDVDVVLFGYDDDFDKNNFKSENTKCVCNGCKENDCPSTTPTVKAEYYVNGKAVDKDAYEKELEKIESTFDNMRDVLFGYAGFIDEINKWRNLFRW